MSDEASGQSETNAHGETYAEWFKVATKGVKLSTASKFLKGDAEWRFGSDPEGWNDYLKKVEVQENVLITGEYVAGPAEQIVERAEGRRVLDQATEDTE